MPGLGRSVVECKGTSVSDLATNPEHGPDSASGPTGEPAAEAGIDEALRDIGEVPAVEVITTVAIHLMSAAAVKCGLGEEGDASTDLDEARKLINALAGLVVTAAPDLGTFHAAPLRDGLTSLQLAFREASAHPDPPGRGPGEQLTGPVA
jgi:hypothetical protein